MGVSVVNGYFCANSCDVAKAKKGEDPHPALHTDNADKKDATGATRGDDPSVVFGGALAALGDPSRVAPTANAQDTGATTGNSHSVDLLA